jgi:PAS domain S-box-containing protein
VILLKVEKQKRKHKEAHMDFNTEQVKEGIEQIATLLSELLVRYAKEEEHVGIAHVSPEGHFLRINQKFCDIVGYSRDEMLRMTFQDIIHPDDLDADLNHVQLLLAGESDTYIMEKRYFRKNGETVWVNLTVSMLREHDGKPIWFVSVVENISERKQIVEELEQREALARVDRTTSMGQLTGSISHELNQPLTGILSNAQAAEMMIESGHWEKEDLSEIMADIVADAKRAGDVIRNLRQLYREQRVEFLPVDINAIVEETTKLLRSEFIIQRVLFTTQF